MKNLFSFKKETFSAADRSYMTKALELAGQALGISSPDPVVGAVVVKNGKIVGEGFHGAFATPHAETWAIQKARRNAAGATIYVTLEPCCHFGNNPPCCTTIINAGLKRVVVAMSDPNPLVNGKGVAELRAAGIRVDVGLMEVEAKKQNEAFIKFITKKIPFVTLKSALSMDGKIAAYPRDSKWITSKESRVYAHYLRSINDATMVGVGTVLQDNPDLTPRLAPNWLEKSGKVKVSRPKTRIVIDPLGKTPLSAKVCRTKKNPTIIVVSKKCPADRIRALEKKGCQIMVGSGQGEKVSFSKLMAELGKTGFASILIEGGGNVAASALKDNVVDKVIYIYAPKIIGGKNAVTAVEGTGVKSPAEAWQLKDLSILTLGEDWIVRGYAR